MSAMTAILAPTHSRATQTRCAVLVLGPDPAMTGGMSAVVGQMMRLDWPARYAVTTLPDTSRKSNHERWLARVARHILQGRVIETAIKENGVRLVHIHTCSGMSFWRSAVDAWLARRLGCRVVLHLHGARFDEFHAECEAWGQSLIRGVLRRADIVIALSQGWADWILSAEPHASVRVVENAVELPAERSTGFKQLERGTGFQPLVSGPGSQPVECAPGFQSVPCGTGFQPVVCSTGFQPVHDPAEFSAGAAQVKNLCHTSQVENLCHTSQVENPCHTNGTQPAADCGFLMLARMDAWKGVDDLLDACVQLQARGAAFELILAGPPGSAGDARTLARKIADRQLTRVVHYVGEVRGRQKAGLLARADVLVQPSHSEGMPITVLEAFANGLAVVATRVGAMPEVVEHGATGLLVGPREPHALAAAMECLARDADLRTRCGENARRVAETRFSPARFRDDLMRIYDELCG
ncbi:MAG: glycosyltransferase family 4 protein [Phycisphaerales bacterium]|nr:glycosyltransferase family 4 protein [Phycisphaerales bacterium]